MLFNPTVASEPMLFLRLTVFQRCFNASRFKYAKILYMRRMFAMGRKSVVTLDCFVFGNIWNNVLRQARGISPFLKILFMMQRMVDHTFSGAKCSNSATKPHSPEALFAFIRLIACLNSCKLQSVSVSWGGGNGLLGCPLKRLASMFAKSFGGGWSATWRPMPCCSLCSSFHWLGWRKCIWRFDDFHFRSSRRWSLTIWKDNSFLIPRFSASRRCNLNCFKSSEGTNLVCSRLHSPPSLPAMRMSLSNFKSCSLTVP